MAGIIHIIALLSTDLRKEQEQAQQMLLNWNKAERASIYQTQRNQLDDTLEM
jgi:hypothetical protein